MTAASWNSQTLTLGYYYPAIWDVFSGDQTSFVASSGTVEQVCSDFYVTFSSPSPLVEDIRVAFTSSFSWTSWSGFNGFGVIGPSGVSPIASVSMSTNSGLGAAALTWASNSVAVNWSGLYVTPSTYINLVVTFTATPPSITIASVGDLTNQPVQTIAGTTGTEDAGQTVFIYDNGVLAGSGVVGSDGAWQAAVTLGSQGANALVAKVTDSGGTGVSNTVTYTLDTIPPVVTVALVSDTGASATDGVTYDDALTGTAEAGENVTILGAGGAVLGAATPSGSGVWSFTPSLADGVQTVTVEQTDVAGNTGSASLTFTLDTHTPLVTLALARDTGASASDGVTYDDALTGTADPGAMVTITEAGKIVATAQANASGVWAATPTLADGAATLVATDTDLAGKSGTASLSFVLDTHTPAAPGNLRVTSPSNISGGVTVIPLGQISTIAGTAEAGDTVAVYDGASELGTAQANGAGVWTLTLAEAMAAGANSITAAATDLAGKISAASNPLTVVPETGPVAAAVSTLVAHNRSTSLTALIEAAVTPGYAGDVDTVVAVSGSAGALLSNGVASYAAGASGSDSFTYTVQNEFGQTATNTVNVTVDPGPQAGNGAIVVGHGQSVNVTALLDSLIAPGESGDSETITSATGGAQIGAGGSVVYTAPNNSGGTTSFGYTVTDQLGDSSTGTVAVTIDGGPLVGAGSLLIGHGQSENVTALVDSLIVPGLAGDAETVVAVSGRATLAANGAIIYTAPSQAGGDSFTYTVKDQLGDTTTGIVNVDVDAGPTAATGEFAIGHSQSENVTSIIDALITPGQSGDTETITAVSGNAVLNPNGTVTYTAPSHAGLDSFSYTVTDQLGDTATNTVTVAIDPGPVALNGSLTIGHGQSANVTSLLDSLIGSGLAADTNVITSVSGNATLNPNGTVTYTAPNGKTSDSFTYTVVNEFDQVATGTVNVTVDPGPTTATGSLLIGHGQSENVTALVDSLIAPGEAGDTETVTSVSGNAVLNNGVVTYTAPVSGSSDSFTYTVEDQRGDVSTGAVNVTVDPGPAAGSGSVTVGHGQTVNLTTLIAGLIGKGVAGDTETVVSVSGNATLSNGAVSYTAPASGSSDSFTYTLQDQLGDRATGTVAVTIDPGPKLAAGGITIGHGQSMDVTSLVDSLIAPGLAGDSETVTAVSGGAVLKNGKIVYTAPNAGVATSFGYTATDQYGDRATGTVNVTVDPGPTAATGSQAVGNNTSTDMTAYVESLISPGLPGDVDTITGVSGANVTDIDGDIVYNAPSGGPDSFTYTVVDQRGDTSTGTVNVQVDPGPIIAAGLITLEAGASADATSYVDSLIAPGLPGDTDTILSVSGPNVTMNPDGSIVYTAPTDLAHDSFTVTVENQRGEITTGTVAVDISHANTTVNLQGESGIVIAPNSYIEPTYVDGGVIDGPSTGYSTVTGNNSDLTINAYGYANTTIAGGGDATVNAGLTGATVVVSDGDGNNTVTGFVSNSVVILDDGDNTITLGGYNNAVTLGNGDNIVKAGVGEETVMVGNGNNTITTSGTANTISVGTGVNTIVVGSGGNTVDIAGGTDIVTADGYNNLFNIDGGATSITGLTGEEIFNIGAGFSAASSIDIAGFAGGMLAYANGVWTLSRTDGELFATFNLPSGEGLKQASDGNGGTLITLGAPVPPAPSAADTIVETSGGQNVTLSAPTTDLVLFGYQNTVTSASGGFTISGDEGGSTFNLAGDGNTLLLGGTSDTITLGLGETGDNNVSGGTGWTTIETGDGSQTISTGGLYNSISTGDGNSTIDAGIGYDSVTVGNGDNSIVAAGDHNTISTAGGSTMVALSGWNNSVIVGSGLTTVTGGYTTTFYLTSPSAAGGLDAENFSLAYHDVLDVTGLEQSLGVGLSAFTALPDKTDGTAVDIYVAGPNNSTTLVATLHGVGGNQTIATLVGYGALVG
jgi:hypothetical protein